MSLIHEALKKVERQRQLGKAPTLDSPRFRRRRRRWPWVFVVLLALVAVGAWAWRGPLIHKARSVATRIMGSDVAASSTPAPATRSPADSRESKAPSRSIASLSSPHATQAAARTSSSDKKTAAATPLATGATEQHGQPRKPPGHPDAWLPPAKKSAKPVTDNKPLAEARAGQTGAPSSGKKPAAVGQLQAKGPPMYWELPYAQRRDIPELNISMHMYTDTPADRFVIINGVRQVQGDTLPSGLKLIAINPDSITLDKDGQRFRVPRRGSH
ncbi:MAG: general secretion pathway protein GspB [Rhodanobacteraceae bacterium]